jgi:3-dehydroquinate dehydratase-2
LYYVGPVADFRRLDAEGAACCIFNPGGYTFTSVALRDTLATLRMKVLEVHIFYLQAREPFRPNSLLAAACVGQISGFGIDGYTMALFYILERERLPA